MPNPDQQTLEIALPLPKILRDRAPSAFTARAGGSSENAPKRSPMNQEADSLKAEVLKRDHHRCQLHLPGCEGHATELDRVETGEYGGDGSSENLRAACKSCERTKGQAFRLLG
jgi:5-methylcytosine-specific restriction endonuclease McrA